MYNTLDLNLFKKSSIGTNVDGTDKEVHAVYNYTAVDQFFVWFFGTTRMPKKITFTCISTGEVFEELTDIKLIEHYMLYRKK